MVRRLVAHPELAHPHGARLQQTVRAEMDQLWTNTTGGIPGNDDAGTMSSWYVFSAMGMYPGVPTQANMVLTAPLFPHIVIHRGNGKTITIDAPEASATNKYIQSLTVNGRSSTKPWVPASLINQGGSLSFTLGSAPDMGWGSAADGAPPTTTYSAALSAVAADLRKQRDVVGSVAHDVQDVADAFANGDRTAMAQLQALLANIESANPQEVNDAALNRLRSLLQSGIGLQTPLAALHQQISTLTRSDDIAWSTARKLQDLVTAAETAQARNDSADVHAQLQALQNAINAASTKEVSQGAKDALLPAVEKLLTTT